MAMISIPVFMFVLFCISILGNALTIFLIWYIRRLDKKDYERYIEEEYGKTKDK